MVRSIWPSKIFFRENDHFGIQTDPVASPWHTAAHQMDITANPALWDAVGDGFWFPNSEVERLLTGGADVEQQGAAADGTLSTPLQKATDMHNVDVVRLLLDHGACVSTKSGRGHGPLIDAVANVRTHP
jgi:hypothetical protein